MSTSSGNVLLCAAESIAPTPNGCFACVSLRGYCVYSPRCLRHDGCFCAPLYDCIVFGWLQVFRGFPARCPALDYVKQSPVITSYLDRIKQLAKYE